MGTEQRHRVSDAAAVQPCYNTLHTFSLLPRWPPFGALHRMAYPTTNQVIAAIFGRSDTPFARWYTSLLDASPLLRVFSVDNQTKIRKKLRIASDTAAQRDLQCELAVAAQLVTDRRSQLVYEPLAAEHRRGPDFLLRHKQHTAVYFEVSRIRHTAATQRDPHERIAAILCGKLTQLAANSANVLVLINDGVPAELALIDDVIKQLRQRANAKDNAYFAFRGLEGARDFLRWLPLLSGVLVITPAAQVQELSHVPAARHPLPADLARMVAAWDLATIIGPMEDDEHTQPSADDA